MTRVDGTVPSDTVQIQQPGRVGNDKPDLVGVLLLQDHGPHDLSPGFFVFGDRML